MQADGMKRKILALFTVFFMLINTSLFINLTEMSRADVLPRFYVDDNAESSWYDDADHFDNIQDAIDNASSGDRILVYAGTYSERLVIHSNKTSISIFGEDKSLVTITGGGSQDVISIYATGVSISSFTIQNCGTSSNNSVIKINASNCIITDNIISNSNGKNGIYIHNCSNTKIYYNTLSGSTKNGIHLENSNWNNITYTTVSSNTYNGIFIYNCSNNTIDYCTIQSNSKNGIHLNRTCNYNTISNSNISSNTMNGIYMNDFCNNNIVSINSIYSNSDSGLRIENSSSNNFGSNTINSNSDYGVMVVGTNNSVHNGTINFNSKHGVFLFGDNRKRWDDTLDHHVNFVAVKV